MTVKITDSLTALAAEFDRQRDCRWNFTNLPRDYNSEEFFATDVPKFASLGDQCWGTILELALLHTLRPCKVCGGAFLYKSGYKIACCSCFGDHEGCKECRDGGCGNCAENMNLPDAITRWNLNYGDAGARGRVVVIG